MPALVISIDDLRTPMIYRLALLYNRLRNINLLFGEFALRTEQSDRLMRMLRDTLAEIGGISERSESKTEHARGE